MSYSVRFIIGLSISIIIAFGGYKKHSLTISGAVGAIILGTGIFFSSGLYGSFLIVFFFMTSSIFSYVKKRSKNEFKDIHEKGANRDFFQVFANGGVGLIYSILYFFSSDPIYLILIGVSFAAANADTWASELGVLSSSLPVSLRTLKKVPKGTSGAISLWGTFLSLIGALLIGFSSVFMILIFHIDFFPFSMTKILLLITFGGILGSLIDSLLGATIQAIYYNEELKKETEKPSSNGKTNTLIRGYKIINNDFVNVCSIMLSSIIILFLI